MTDPTAGAPETASRARALALLTAIEDGCATARIACPGGLVIRDARHPRVWSSNHVRVESPTAPDAAALDAAAARHLDALGFRMIIVREEAVGRALASPLAALGYRATHQLLMTAGPAPDVMPDPVAAPPVVEVSHARLACSRVEAQVELGRDAEIGRQLHARDAVIETVVAVRRFAVVDGGAVAARCQLYADGQIAQIENLYVAPAWRGRGLGRVVGEHALHAARAAGAQLVVAVADAEGWPQSFYRRVGFAGVGLLPRFLRP
jgi:ribosomal protein S18 acetylase RimI-like enzyme